MMSASHTPEETKAALHEVVTEMYDKIVKGGSSDDDLARANEEQHWV